MDWLNLIFIFGAILTIIISKGLYDKTYRLKESILKRHEGDQWYDARAAFLSKQMKKCFKTWPLVLILFVLIALPFFNFFVLHFAAFQSDAQLTLLMSIESMYSIELQFFLLAFMVAITFGFGILTKNFTAHVKRERPVVNVFHPDRVGGYRGFGVATLRNLFLWIITYIIIVFIATENMIALGGSGYTSNPSFYLWNAFMVLVGILLSIIIFINPLKHIHGIIVQKRREVFKEISDSLQREYVDPILEKESDYFKISEARKTTFLQDLTEASRLAAVQQPTEEEYQMLINRLNILTWQNYHENASEMRDWPWDTSIIAKFYFLLFIPIVVAVINVWVLQLL